MPLKSVIAHIGSVNASVWMPIRITLIDVCLPIFTHRLSCQHWVSTMSWFCCRSRCGLVSSQCRISLVPLELRHPSPRTQSPTKLPSPLHQTFPVGNWGLTPPPYCPAPNWCGHWLCTFPHGPQQVINLHNETHKPVTSWHLTISLSDNIENCLLLAILGSMCMSVSMYILHRIVLQLFTSEKEVIKHSSNFRCVLLLFIYLFINVIHFLMIFQPKLLGFMAVGGGGGCSLPGIVTRSKSEVQWAKMWRTMGQNVT